MLRPNPLIGFIFAQLDFARADVKQPCDQRQGNNEMAEEYPASSHIDWRSWLSRARSGCFSKKRWPALPLLRKPFAPPGSPECIHGEQAGCRIARPQQCSGDYVRRKMGADIHP